MSLLKFPWIILKLIYLHLGFAVLGLDPEYFYIHRGNYFYQLGCYKLAIGNYNTALENYESTDPFLKSALGYCYLMVGNNKKALSLYREAYQEDKHPDNLLGLVCAEMNNENYDKGLLLFKQLLERKTEFDTFHAKEVERLKNQFIKDGLLTNENNV